LVIHFIYAGAVDSLDKAQREIDMKKEHAIRMAQEENKESSITMAVVVAPVEHAEDESGPYGFCPLAAVETLYSRGTVVVVITEEDTIYRDEPALV
jgi:aromatic ring-opening dioxygenase LigB subunit